MPTLAIHTTADAVSVATALRAHALSITVRARQIEGDAAFGRIPKDRTSQAFGLSRALLLEAGTLNSLAADLEAHVRAAA